MNCKVSRHSKLYLISFMVWIKFNEVLAICFRLIKRTLIIKLISHQIMKKKYSGFNDGRKKSTVIKLWFFNLYDEIMAWAIEFFDTHQNASSLSLTRYCACKIKIMLFMKSRALCVAFISNNNMPRYFTIIQRKRERELDLYCKLSV